MEEGITKTDVRTKNAVMEAAGKLITKEDKDGFLLISTQLNTESYKVEMIQKNSIPSLLTVKVQAFNDGWQYRYEVGEMLSLKECFHKSAPRADEICGLMKQIEDTGKVLSAYLLAQEDLVLDMDCIYMQGQDYFFTYLPDYGKEMGIQLSELLGGLMGCMDYKDRSSVSLVYLLHGRVQQKGGNIPSLKKVCDEILQMQAEEERYCAEECDMDGIFTPDPDAGTALSPARDTKKSGKNRRQAVGFSGDNSVGGCHGNNKSVGIAAQNQEQDAKSRIFYTKIKSCKEKLYGFFRGFSGAEKGHGEYEEICCEAEIEYEAGNFRDMGSIKRGIAEERLVFQAQEDTVLLNGAPEESGDTVLLGGETRSCFLEPKEKGRDCIRLTGYPFWLGKETFENGYSFADAVVSRKHAKILKEGEEYFIVDTGSLNGTSVGGKRLMPQECRRISPGDIIGLAEIYYTFTCL